MLPLAVEYSYLRNLIDRLLEQYHDNMYIDDYGDLIINKEYVPEFLKLVTDFHAAIK